MKSSSDFSLCYHEPPQQPPTGRTNSGASLDIESASEFKQKRSKIAKKSFMPALVLSLTGPRNIETGCRVDFEKSKNKSCLCELSVRPRRLLLQLLLLLLLLQLCLCLRLAKVARTGFEATLKNNCSKDTRGFP